jgi:uncharacterized iron-regulated membrane protein
MASRAARSKSPVLKLVHTWTGIIAGVFLSVLALTGSVIVFRVEFERAALPKSAPVSSATLRVSLDEAAREIVRVRPDAHIRRVRMPAAPSDPYIFQVESSGKRTERLVSDASSGRVLGTVESGWIAWVVDLHRNFLAGKSGRKAVGIAGIVLLVLSATGLLMWLTGARRWRAWISLRREGSTRRFNFELHRASGLWAYSFLAVISFTGIGLAFPETYRQAMHSMTGAPATVPAPKGIKAKVERSLDEYLRAGRGAMPDGVATELRLPESGKGPVDLRLYRPGDLAPGGNHVYLEPATAAVVRVDRIADRPVGARFLAAMAPIHYGEFGGIPIKVAWALLGLTPILLFVTGLIAWWRPAKQKPGQLSSAETGREDRVLAGR